MNDFVAIDLETASRFHNSACALGLVIVNDGAIVEKMKWLIRPPQNESALSSEFNIDLDHHDPVSDATAAAQLALLICDRAKAKSLTDATAKIGYHSRKFSAKLDYLVVGIQNRNIVGKDGLSSKMRKAKELAAKGHKLR